MKHPAPRVYILSFSPRRDGNCAAIGAYVRGLYGDAADLLCFSDFTISPCGGCKYECFAGGPDCPHSGDMEQTLLDGILSHDLTYFIVPNYCDYPCSGFFAFCERQQACFTRRPDRQRAYAQARKRFIVVSNTNRSNFEQAFSCHTDQPPSILYLSARQYGKSSLAGDLLTSDAAKADVRAFVAGP